MDMGIGTILSLIKFLSPWQWVLKIKNLFTRPRLNICLKNCGVVFISQDGKEHHIPYLCLSIVNRAGKDYSLNLHKVNINRETYQAILGSDPNYLRLNLASNDPWKSCTNDILNIYKANSSTILENNFYLPLSSYKPIIFPMTLIKEKSQALLQKKINSKIFWEKNKIIITLEIDGDIYEYGLNRTLCYEIYINYLAFYKIS